MRIAPALAIPVVALALCVSAATAAPSGHDAAQGNAFCTRANGIAKYLASTLTLTNGVAEGTPANLKLAYTTIASSERGLNAAAPKSLRPSLLGAFSFINLAKTDLAQVSWEAPKLLPYLPALVANGKKNGGSIKVVEAYLKGTCHIDV